MPDGEQVPERFRAIFERIVERIAAGDFNGLTRDYSPHADDPQYDFGVWARQYPATFIPLPAEAWRYAWAFRREDDGAWLIDLDLWSAEEGRSDMTLQATVYENNDQLTIELTDLHVM